MSVPLLDLTRQHAAAGDEVEARVGEGLRAGRRRYEERFTFERMFERTRRIYEEVAAS